MNGNYDDILSRIAEDPLWYDEHGVPRYEPFTPDRASNIYAEFAILAEVVCQSCVRSFVVCCTYGKQTSGLAIESLEESVRAGDPFLYGDPPRHQEGNYLARTAKIVCSAGDSMNTEAVSILEFWRKSHRDWERDHSLEGPLPYDGDPEEKHRITKGRW